DRGVAQLADRKSEQRAGRRRRQPARHVVERTGQILLRRRERVLRLRVALVDAVALIALGLLRAGAKPRLRLLAITLLRLAIAGLLPVLRRLPVARLLRRLAALRRLAVRRLRGLVLRTVRPLLGRVRLSVGARLPLVA